MSLYRYKQRIVLLPLMLLLVAGLGCKRHDAGQPPERQTPQDTSAQAVQPTNTLKFSCRLSRTIPKIAPHEAFRRTVELMENKLAMGKVITQGDSVIQWRVSMEGPLYDLSVTFSPAPHGTLLTISSTQTNESAAAISEKNWLDVIEKGMKY